MEMQMQYWLELLVPKSAYPKLSKLFGEKGDKRDRTLLQVFQQNYSADPGAHVIHHMLDHVGLHYDVLNDFGISRDQVAVWIDCQSDSGTYELEWDPLTLMRMGEEKHKLCIKCGGIDWDNLGKHPTAHPKWVEIEDVWLENKEEEYTSVYVSFDDGTLWFANVLPYEEVEKQRIHNQIQGKNLNGEYFWQPHLLLVESASQEAVEEVVMDLLKKHSFERVFHSFDPKNESFKPDLISEISMIHEEDQIIPLQEILGGPKLEVIHTKNYAKLRQHAHEGSIVAHLHGLMDLLEKNYRQLAKYGVQRHDIAITLLNRYEGQVCLEFDGELTERLGRNGITLQLCCNLTEREVARTIG